MPGEKRGVTFRNNSNVRNLYLYTRYRKPVSTAVNYKAPTKQNNGPSAASSSRVQENFKKHPARYPWNSSHSYANTYEAPSEAMQRYYSRNSIAAQKKFGDFWVDAVIINQTHRETAKAMADDYLASVRALMETKFGQVKSEMKFLKWLKKCVLMENDLAKGKVTQEEVSTEFDATIDPMCEKTTIEKSALLAAYPEFLQIGLDYIAKLDIETKQKHREMRALLKTKRANNVLKGKRTSTRKAGKGAE
jgi:hypothetical protein